MDEDDYDWDDHHPCDDCGLADYCDGWDAKYCCDLCNHLGGGDCDTCNPMDI